MKSEFKTICSNSRYELLIHGGLAYWPDEYDTPNVFIEKSVAMQAEIGDDLSDALALAWKSLVQHPGTWTILVREKVSPFRTFFMTDLLGRDQFYFRLDGVGSDRVEELFGGEIDPVYVGAVAKFGYYVGSRTYAENVFRVQPGNLVTVWPSGRMELRPLWYKKLDRGNSPEELKSLVTSCFYNDLLDVFSGKRGLTVLVSGGLDSSIMAHLVMEDIRGGGPLSLLDVEFLTIDNGEDIKYAGLLAEKEGFDLTVLNPKPEENLLESALIAADSPVDLGSLIPNYQLIKAASHEHILTGDGPDELFGGYSRIHEYDSQLSDIFMELSFYHLPKLTNTSRYLGKSLICPYLDPAIISFALSTDLYDRTDKSILKRAFADELPSGIINRDKFALKSDSVRLDKIAHRMKCLYLFLDTLKTKKQ